MLLEDDYLVLCKGNSLFVSLKLRIFLLIICMCLFWRWVNQFMGVGYKKDLEVDDLYSCLDEDKSEDLGLALQKFNN